MTVESADRNCTDAYMEKLDDLFGLTSDFNAHVVSNLERTHAQDRIDTRSVRSSIIVRSVTIAMLVMTVGALALMISSLMGIIGGSADGIVGAWRRCYGLVPSALALTVNTTLLALVASINVALAAATGRADRQEDAINAYWRRMLGWCVYGAAAGASVFSFMQFAGIGGMNGTGGSDKSNTGTAIAAVCVGMLTVFLAVTLVEYGSASNRARNFVDAQKRRRDIAGWIFTIRQMDVPINIAAETGLRLKWLPKVPRFVVVMLIFGLFSLGYTYVAVEAVSLTYADRLFVRRPSWTDVVFAVSVVGYSAGISYVIGSTAWRRWSSPKGRAVRWQLNIWPAIFRGGYFLAVSLLIMMLARSDGEDWRRTIVVLAALAGPFIVTPAISWITLWLSRRVNRSRSDPAWERRSDWREEMKNWLGDLVVWLAAPVWQNVSRSLSEYYRNSTSRRDRAYDEEAAAERRRVSELPGADQHIGAAANTAVDDSIASATQ